MSNIYTTQLVIDVEDPSIIKTLKTLARQLKGVMSVREVKPKTKMSEKEFYDMIDHSAKTARTDGANMKKAEESMSEYLNRLIH